MHESVWPLVSRLRFLNQHQPSFSSKSYMNCGRCSQQPRAVRSHPADPAARWTMRILKHVWMKEFHHMQASDDALQHDNHTRHGQAGAPFIKGRALQDNNHTRHGQAGGPFIKGRALNMSSLQPCTTHLQIRAIACRVCTHTAQPTLSEHAKVDAGVQGEM